MKKVVTSVPHSEVISQAPQKGADKMTVKKEVTSLPPPQVFEDQSECFENDCCDPESGGTSIP
jgi:hypothetical protein